MIREFSVVIEKDEDGYFVASVPTLRGCHTQAKSLDVLMKRVKEAIELCLEVEEPIPTEFVGVQRVAVTAWARFLPSRRNALSRPLGNSVLKSSERRGVIISFAILIAGALLCRFIAASQLVGDCWHKSFGTAKLL
jgi:predicted RNase H-like HicB family nuclease